MMRRNSRKEGALSAADHSVSIRLHFTGKHNFRNHVAKGPNDSTFNFFSLSLFVVVIYPLRNDSNSSLSFRV